MSTTIDTLSYVKRLEAAGVDRKTAEAHTEAINAHVVPELATKADIESLLWKHSLATLLGVLTIGGLLIRFVK